MQQTKLYTSHECDSNVKEGFTDPIRQWKKKSKISRFKAKASSCNLHCIVHSRNTKFSLNSKKESKNDGDFNGAVKKKRVNKECAG